MSLGMTDGTGGQWQIGENNTPDAYVVVGAGGQVVLDPSATGGAWLFRHGGQYLIDAAGQPFMAVTHAVVTASTSAVALNTAAPTGITLTIKNTSGNAADLGGSTVTGGTGFALAASAVVTVSLKPGDILYAIRTASSDATLSVLRT